MRRQLAQLLPLLLGACAPQAQVNRLADENAAPPRVFVIADKTQLMHGMSAVGKIGDYRLDNGRVAFIIDKLGAKQGFASSGGNLMDAGISNENLDALSQTFLYLDDTFPRQAEWKTLEPFTEVDAAGIRVTGRDINDETIAIAHEYRLERGATSLRLRTTVRNTGAQTIENYELGDALQWGKTDHFAVGVGFELGGKRLSLPWVAGVGDRVSYALAGPGDLQAQSGSSWTDVVYKTVSLATGESATYERYLFVGQGDVASMLGEIARRRGEHLSEVSGRVSLHDGSPVIGAEVWFDSVRKLAVQNGDAQHAGDTKPFLLAHTRNDGRYTAPLPAGDYMVRVESPSERSPPQPLTVHGTLTRNFQLDPGGEVSFAIHDAAGLPLAGKIVIYGRDGTPNPKLGPIFSATGAVNAVLTATGNGSFVLPTGRYRLFACHGIEYDVDRFELEVTPHARFSHSFALNHVLDTRGYLSGDFHQHAANSYDSAVSLTDRATSNLAEGVEILVGTDHDFVTDYRPILAALHADGRVVTMGGDEATTHTIGHFMGFPMAWRPELPRNGAPDTWGKTAGQIFADLRDDPLDKVVQVNHPRSGATGFFDLLHLTFDKGVPVADPNFDDSFDAIEAFNGKRVEEAEHTLEDWMSFAARGKRYTLTGNSDTHALVFQEAGYPRNFVRMADDLNHFDVPAFTEAVKRRHAVIVSNGPFAEIFVGDQTPPAQAGDTLKVRADSVAVRYRVQAAPWVDVTRFELWSNGKKVFETPVAPSNQVVRLQGSFNLPVKKSGYVFAVVHGEKSLEPVLPTKGNKPTKPFGFTNPVYLEKP